MGIEVDRTRTCTGHGTDDVPGVPRMLLNEYSGSRAWVLRGSNKVSMSERSMDIAVIGAGPCGLAVAAAARQADLRAVLFDRGPLCSSIVRYPPYVSFFSTPEKLEIENLPFVTARPNPNRKEALTYYRGVARYFGLDVRQYHNVETLVPGEESFRLQTRTTAGEIDDWVAEAVVVATGGFDGPNYLAVPGEELSKVSHYYGEAHPYWDQDVVVVGGGNSAVEAALELFRVGSRVMIVHFGSSFDSGVKAWVLPDILNRIKHREVAVRWRHRVAEIHPRSVILRAEDTGGIDEIPNDWVLALTGWRPDPVLLRSAGVPVDEETGVPAHDPSTMETPIPGLFIAGVLAAGLDANRVFIENGRFHGQQIVERFLSSR